MKTTTGCFGKLRAMSVHIGVFWLILVSVEGWTYHVYNTSMSWTASRELCRTNYTDIVVIDNENVTHFLQEFVEGRNSSPYYWIGLKKINGNWMWVANGQIMNYQNWAGNEPNNALSSENCVEMYSSKGNNGKWNDDDCEGNKYPVCHKAQCQNTSCSNKGICKEQVNNFTCVCKPGFSGPRCETVECFPLLLFGGGMMNCTEGHDSFRSACRVQCPPGRLLLGFTEFTCRADGMWESSFPLMCASLVHFQIALLASVVISVFCCCFCCSNGRKKLTRKY
ncbi:L-selectin-like isoform X2 [Pimephales promelas]|uniref:L-selectin-like isoform X2 n=1 Tax=Pimephales promelas TaxID=90988 RepID=UPI0019559A82|nr:L-selectin-like isoform X2 [Pimephales promelas]